MNRSLVSGVAQSAGAPELQKTGESWGMIRASMTKNGPESSASLVAVAMRWRDHFVPRQFSRRVGSLDEGKQWPAGCARRVVIGCGERSAWRCGLAVAAAARPGVEGGAGRSRLSCWARADPLGGADVRRGPPLVRGLFFTCHPG